MEPTTQIFQAQPFKVGQLIAGRYRVVAFLGAGSMGWVLKVEDEALAGAVVALKVLYPHLSRDRTSALRFRQEVVLARQLAHPSIIHVHDFEESADGETFIALEYVEGASLDSILKEQNGQGLPFDEAILILARMGEALLYAHQQGVLHRDLKPSNILVGRDGAIKLTDFGLAKSFQQEFGLTRTGEALGTPLYMAPEQFRAEATDQRTDIYAFGILAYELVAGTPPFRGDDFFALAEQHITTPPTFENKRIASAPPWFQALIRHCCEKKPADRPISMVEVLPLLTEKLAGSTQLTVALRYATPTRRFSRRAQRTIFALVTTAILLGLAALAWQQTNTRVFICSRVLTAEYRMGIEVPLLKRLLNIQGSLLRPQSAFEALHDEGGVLLHFLLTANKLLRDDGEPIEPLANLRDAAGYTLLQRAVQTNAWRIVDPFTDKDLDFNLTDPNGDTAFIATLKGNKVHTYTSLLTNKYFRIDGPDAAGDLPLHIAVRLGNVGAVDHMLREVKNSGASLRNAKGEHILHLAARLPNSAILAQLLAAGVDPTVRDREGRTVLMEAVRTKGPAHETEALIRILFQPRFRQAGVDIHALDNHGTNALMYALEAQNELAVRKLIAAGAKLEQRNDAGLTAYDYARQSGMLHLLPPELQ